MIHEVDSLFIQAMLYALEARACCSSSTIADIPKSSYSGRAPRSAEEIQPTLHQNVVDKYSYSQNLLDRLFKDSAGENILKDITKQLISLLPFAFGSMLFLTTHAQVSDLSMNVSSLSQLINDAVRMKAPDTAYSLVVDIILSAVTDPAIEEGDFTREPAPAARLPTSCATELLSKLIHSIRNETTYDMPRASRWIRCVVQLILDQHGIARRITTSRSRVDSVHALRTVKTVTEQALALAKSSNWSASTRGSEHLSRYPVEEVEWLASTLFNLSVDILYCNQNVNQGIGIESKPVQNEPRPEQSSTCHGVDTDSQMTPSAISEGDAESGVASGAKVPRDAGTALSGDAAGHDVQKDSLNVCTDAKDTDEDDDGVTSPQLWASLAVQLADQLDASLGSPAQVIESRVPGDPRASAAEFADTQPDSQERQEDGGAGYGDGGALARAIRERCRMLGWADIAL